MASGTRVTCEDIETGETESRVIRDDYALIVDGAMELAHLQVYRNGTVQIVLKPQREVEPVLE